ncbi:hypothetical protein [Herbidospora cretacea]|uniref:hypothetical protein n=1 Tax=Herbidospora cretacea TaxID=28444 RepID=UPI0007739FB9|nr:hypothetical protein [Herbidospora cretacea]
MYVETLVRADPGELWRLTQDPALHTRWDLRFTEIRPIDARRFRYRFTVIAGEGVTVADRSRGISTLRFSSGDPRSPIRSGSGYWRYVPVRAGVRFLTRYDYTPRHPGLDLMVRPLLWWATAWSFDRLRLWLERGRRPEFALLQAVAEAAVRVAAVAWAHSFWVALAAVALPHLPTTPSARRCRFRDKERR